MRVIFIDESLFDEAARKFIRNMDYYGIHKALSPASVSGEFRESTNNIVNIMREVEDVLAPSMGASLIDRLNERYKKFANSSVHLDFGDEDSKLKFWHECRITFSQNKNIPRRDDEKRKVISDALEDLIRHSAHYYRASKGGNAVPFEVVERAVIMGKTYIPGHEANVVSFEAARLRKG